MKKYIYRILCFIFLIMVFLLILTIKSSAATLSVTSSAKTVQPGQTFTVTVKISGGAGYATLSASNATLNKSATSFLDNSSETITCTAGNTNGATITISANATIGDYKTEKDETRSASTSITIKKKETTQKPTTTTKKPTTTTTSKAASTKAATKKEETKKKETKKDDFYITKLSLKGVKENEEKVDIELAPKFSKNTYEYSCKISSDIQKIELEKEAGDYNKYITVTGIDELKEGENTITVKLAKEGQTTRTYTIKLTKEAATVETSAKVEEQSQNEETASNDEQEVKQPKEPIMVSMPLGAFIAMQAGIIVIEVIAIYFIPWKKIFGKKIDKK